MQDQILLRSESRVLPDTQNPDIQPDAAMDMDTGDLLRIHLDDRLYVAWGAVLSQKAGDRLRAVRFADEFVLFYVNWGTLHVNIDGKPHTATKGQTLLIWPGEECVGAQPTETELMCQWLVFGVDHSLRSGELEPIEIPRLTEVCDPDRIAELFRILVEEYHVSNRHRHSTPEHLSSQGVKLLLLSLLSRISAPGCEELTEPNALTMLAERGRNYMRANLQMSISTEDVAAELNCSARYLRKAFQHTYGYSPSTCILDLRLMRARDLLGRTHVPISQIARACGFESQNYFTRVFKHHEGVAPSRYRVSHNHTYTVAAIS